MYISVQPQRFIEIPEQPCEGLIRRQQASCRGAAPPRFGFQDVIAEALLIFSITPDVPRSVWIPFFHAKHSLRGYSLLCLHH